MISFDKKFVSQWDKHIVYAGNGFGKTRSAEALEKELKNGDSTKVALFTRRGLDDLIADTQKGIFMGETAKYEKELEDLSNKISDAKAVQGAMSQVSGVTKPAAAREISLSADYFNIRNATDIPEEPMFGHRSPQFSIDFKDLSVIKELDGALNNHIFSACQSIERSSGPKSKKNTNSENEIPDDYKEDYISLLVYVRSSNKKSCILCGHRFNGHASLEKAIESQYGKTNFVPSKTIEDKIFRLAEHITANTRDASPILKKTFDSHTPKTIYQALRIVDTYRFLCERTIYAYWKMIASKETYDGTLVEDNVKSAEKCRKAIEKGRKNKSFVHRYNHFLEDEIKKMLSLDGGYSVSGIPDGIGVSLLKDGKATKDNLYNILSESQYKRLCLIALKAEITFGNIDSLILDDPVDSYDDYSKATACEYISGILGLTKLHHWYVLTHDFETLFKLSSMTLAPSIFYLLDFTKTFGGSGAIFATECSYHDIDNWVAKNDVFYLGRFISSKPIPKIDQNIMICALLMTLRNVKCEIIDKCSSVDALMTGKMVCKKCGISAPITAVNDNWKKDVDSKIEGKAEHYALSDATLDGSDKLTLGEVCGCFSALNKRKSGTFPSDNINNKELFIDFRELAVTTASPKQNDWSDIVGYLFRKMSVISYVKYEMERRLILAISSSFSDDETSQVVKTHCLGRKIAKAKEIDNTHKVSVSSKIKIFENVHEKYKTMFNAFDHGLIYQITPYLSTSPKDIEAAWSEISTL